MAGYKAHLTAGALVGGAVLAGLYWYGAYRPGPMLAASLLAVCTAAALFPDVDTDSMARRFFYGIMAAVDVALLVNRRFEWAAGLGLCAMLPALCDHRGWTHTWWAMLAVPLAIGIVPYTFLGHDWRVVAPFYLAGVLGYFTHLLLDRKF